MAINAYARGQLVRVSVKIQTAGADADPTTGPTVEVKNPAGTTTTKVYPTDAEVVKDSPGDYYYDVAGDTEGDWHYRWSGAGTNKGADWLQFRVVEDVFA